MLSFGIPFALILLLLITRDAAMTYMVSRRLTSTLMLRVSYWLHAGGDATRPQQRSDVLQIAGQHHVRRGDQARYVY